MSEPVLTRYNKIREARKAARLSVNQVALYLGIGQMSVYAYEANRRQPSDKAIRKLCQLFGLPPNQFMYYKDKLD